MPREGRPGGSLGLRGRRAVAASRRPPRLRARRGPGRLVGRRLGGRADPAGVRLPRRHLRRHRPRRARRSRPGAAGAAVGPAQTVVPELAPRGWVHRRPSADFRLRDPAAYPRWYGCEHRRPSCSLRPSSGCRSSSAPRSPAPASSPPPAATSPRAVSRSRRSSRPGVIERPRRSSSTPRAGPRARARSRAPSTHFATVNESFTRLRAARPSPHARDRADDRR